MSNISKKLIRRYSNPTEVYRRAKKYLGKTVKIGLSTKKDTKHKNKTRRKNYLTRSRKIKGDWKNNKYSANNLAIHLLW